MPVPLAPSASKAHLFLPDLAKFDEPTKPRKKTINDNIKITWKRKGQIKKIRAKRRVQTVRELKKLHEELLAAQEGEDSEPDELEKVGVDLRSPEEKLLAAKGKLKKLGGLEKMLQAKRRTNPNLPQRKDGVDANKNDEEGDGDDKGKTKNQDKDGGLNPTKYNEGPAILSTLFNAKIRAQAEKFAADEKRRQDRANRNPGVSDWPPWLEEASKTRLQQARNARILHKTKVYLRNDPDSESQLKKLEEKEKKLIIPKLSYQLWSTHVPMPPMDPTISVKPNLRKVEGRRDDYYKLDAIGWNKEDGYVQVLRSSAVDKSFESVYEILKAHLVPASKDGSKELGLGEKVKVFELGSGSGQHAVEVCSRHREVLWQPSDISKLCISSIDARAKQYDVFKSPVNARYMHGNCHEALNFDITMYDKTIALLENKWKSVDLLVALNVVQYAPWRFVENLFKLGNEICKMYGFIFLYGPFRVDGNITHDQQMLELHLKTLSAKFGIRDLEDVIEIAASYQFHLELKFELEGNNLILVFKKAPLSQKKEEVVEEVKEEKVEEEETKDRGERKSMKQRFKNVGKSVRNITRMGSMFKRSKNKPSMQETGKGGEEGEGEGEGGEKELTEEEMQKFESKEQKEERERKERRSRMSKAPRNARRSRQGKKDNDGDNDDDAGKSRSDRKSQMSGNKRNARESRQARQKSRMSRQSKMDTTKKGGLNDQASAAKADALAEAAMNKFM